MNMKNKCGQGKTIELSILELESIYGGGPIQDAIDWYFKTGGSYARGFWDGFFRRDPAVK